MSNPWVVTVHQPSAENAPRNIIEKKARKRRRCAHISQKLPAHENFREKDEWRYNSIYLRGFLYFFLPNVSLLDWKLHSLSFAAAGWNCCTEMDGDDICLSLGWEFVILFYFFYGTTEMWHLTRRKGCFTCWDVAKLSLPMFWLCLIRFVFRYFLNILDFYFYYF